MCVYLRGAIDFENRFHDYVNLYADYVDSKQTNMLQLFFGRLALGHQSSYETQHQGLRG